MPNTCGAVRTSFSGRALAQTQATLATGRQEDRPPELTTAVGAAHAWAGATDEARSLLDKAVARSDLEDSRSAHTVPLVYRAIVELERGSPARAGSPSCAPDRRLMDR